MNPVEANVLLPIVGQVPELKIKLPVKPVQPENALLPILVTEFPIVKLVKP